MKFDFSAHMDVAVVPLAIALYVIGVFLKSTPKIRDWLIPWLLLPLSIVASILLLGMNIASLIQGVLACGLAVLGNQLFKQTLKGLRAIKNSNQH